MAKIHGVFFKKNKSGSSNKLFSKNPCNNTIADPLPWSE